MAHRSTRTWLESQAGVLRRLVAQQTPEALSTRPPSGKWSVHEHLAHLARHQALFVERLRRILEEDGPELGRYRAEEDPDWPEWSRRAADELLERHAADRREVVKLCRGLTPAGWSRVGVHPAFGAMELAQWVEFFLLHEAHHLYVVMKRLASLSSPGP